MFRIKQYPHLRLNLRNNKSVLELCKERHFGEIITKQNYIRKSQWDLVSSVSCIIRLYLCQSELLACISYWICPAETIWVNNPEEIRWNKCCYPSYDENTVMFFIIWNTTMFSSIIKLHEIRSWSNNLSELFPEKYFSWKPHYNILSYIS